MISARTTVWWLRFFIIRLPMSCVPTLLKLRRRPKAMTDPAVSRVPPFVAICRLASGSSACESACTTSSLARTRRTACCRILIFTRCSCAAAGTDRGPEGFEGDRGQPVPQCLADVLSKLATIMRMAQGGR
eukprot:8301065-Alexandrium_andersonii.AAC.1